MWLPSWPWIVGLLAMLRALASPLALLNDPDTYLHIAAGRWMLAWYSLPASDPFSFTKAGAHWVPGEWFGEVILALVYGVLGWGGIIVLSAACFGAAIGLLTHFLLRCVAPLPAVIAALAGAVLVLPHLLARPHVIALPLLVLWCGAILGARDDDRGPPWPLLPVMMLWANIHGSFLFGIALAAGLGGEALLRGGDRRARLADTGRWGGFVAAALLAALIGPNGFAVLTQPFRLMAMPALQSGFGEWMPADLWTFPGFGLWLAGATTLLVSGRRSVPWTRIVLVLGLAYMALAHVRHADLLGLIAPLAMAGGLATTLAAWLRPAEGSPLLRAAAALAKPVSWPAWITIAALAVVLCLPPLLRPIHRTGDAVTPRAAVDAAQRLNLIGKVFNAEAYGGYLAFTGVPTFIDGRIELYGNDFLGAYLAAERGDAAALADLLDRYGISWSLLQAESPAVTALDGLAGWRRVYADGQAVIHQRVD